MPEPKKEKEQVPRFHIVRVGNDYEITQATDKELADAGLGGSDLVGLPSDTLKEAQMKVAHLMAQKQGTRG